MATHKHSHGLVDWWCDLSRADKAFIFGAVLLVTYIFVATLVG